MFENWILYFEYPKGVSELISNWILQFIYEYDHSQTFTLLLTDRKLWCKRHMIFFLRNVIPVVRVKLIYVESSQ